MIFARAVRNKETPSLPQASFEMLSRPSLPLVAHNTSSISFDCNENLRCSSSTIPAICVSLFTFQQTFVTNLLSLLASLRPHVDGTHLCFSLGGLICRHDQNCRSRDYHADEVESVRDVDCSASAIGIANGGVYIGQKRSSLSPSLQVIPSHISASQLCRSIGNTAIDKVCSHEHL